MKSIMLAAAATLAIGTAPLAYARAATPELAPVVAGHSADAATTGAVLLAALFADWDRAGFSEPSKPSQYRVYGRNGYAISGPGYHLLVSLIRSAVTDTIAGRDREAAATIARARSLLASARSVGSRTANVSDLANIGAGSDRRVELH